MREPRRILDVTPPVGLRLPVYPGDPPPVLETLLDRRRGDTYTLGALRSTLHVGAHVDAPLHAIDGGAPVVDLPLSVFVGPARVVDARDAAVLDAAAVERARPRRGERILFRTTNSALWARDGFQEAYVAFSPEGARALADAGAALVGIDYLSVEEAAGSGVVHRTLLGAGVVILEGLDLREVEPGGYFLVAAPLRIEGADGSPVRALLLEL